ncbi:MAG: hypothetical protein AB8B50_04370 [Pirellulaceae bacterium]
MRPSIDRSESTESKSLQSNTNPPEQNSLNSRIERVLADSLKRKLSSDVNAAWQIMHAVICYGDDLKIVVNDESVPALEYLLNGGLVNGFELRLTDSIVAATGRTGVRAKFDPGSYIGQGHVDQWLAILAMADIPLTRKITVGDESRTLLDWARHVQFNVSNNPIDEYSWTLIALTHYFPDEPQWMCDHDVDVNWEMLVEYELTYDLEASACGGTHRLAGIVNALEAKQRLALPDSAIWNEARDRVTKMIEIVEQQRSPDGTLSAYYFFQPGSTRDLFAQLSSTGHLFEFLALACDAEKLKEPWIETSANRLCELIELTSAEDLDCGALYHALHGLKVYQQRRSSSTAQTP